MMGERLARAGLDKIISKGVKTLEHDQDDGFYPVKNLGKRLVMISVTLVVIWALMEKGYEPALMQNNHI
eukprot:6466838-Amphidinium_carterae.1